MPLLNPHFCPVIQIQAMDWERKEGLGWGAAWWESTENSSGTTPSPSSCLFWPRGVTRLMGPSRCYDKVCHKYGLHRKLEDSPSLRLDWVWCQCVPSVHTKTQVHFPLAPERREDRSIGYFSNSIFTDVSVFLKWIQIFLMLWSQQTASTTTSKPHSVPTQSTWDRSVS